MGKKLNDIIENHPGDETLADAILDRIVHDAHRVELKDESLGRKRVLFK